MMRKRNELHITLKRTKCLHLLACAIALSAVTTLIGGEQQRQVDHCEIKGWTEVNKLWPLEDREFFVSFEKGHHYIEVKLPSELENDLMVKFEYFYNHAQVRPTVHLVIGTNNIDLITDDKTQSKKKWLKHEHRVKSADRERRKTLVYNVLLHDPQDVFAWRQIEIMSVHPETTTVIPTTQATSEVATNTEHQVSDSSDNQHIPKTTEAATPTNNESEATSNTGAPTTGLLESTTTQSIDVTMEPALTTTANTGLEGDSSNAETSSTLDPQSGASSTFSNEQTANSDNINDSTRSKREISSENMEEIHSDWDDDNWLARIQRSVDNGPLNMICKPSSCDRGRFHYPRFRPLVKGVPRPPIEQILSGTHKFFLSTDDKPLNFSLTHEAGLTQVDFCIDLQLYMDHGTSLELMVEDELLERIERFRTDSAAGQWDSFKRCISDYMPRLRINGTNDRSARMAFIARNTQAGGTKQVAVFLKKDEAVPLRVLHPTHDYLPDIERLDESSFNDIWVIDKDGIPKPKVKFGEGAVLHISNIDSKQQIFDLTSRWMQVKDLEILENPVLFVYAAEHAAWIKAVDFEYQNANQSGWTSQRVYIAKPEADLRVADQTESPNTNVSIEDSTTSTTIASVVTTVPITESTTLLLPENPQVHNVSELQIPVKLKNLNTDEFRIRLRHLVKETARLEDSLELNLRTLAFGDACAEGNYCLNGGKCVPVGAARAQCNCLTGYSGNRCEIVRPCEVIYGNQTGKELCESIGARCVDDLRVYRCRWPEDPSYESGQNGVSGDGTSVLHSHEDCKQLKEHSDKQARWIIVMAVFMVAFLLFAVVIVANMVSRLLRSKRRLKQAQIEVHELTRRSEPTTSGAAAFGRLIGRHKAHAAVSYNNQSFDAE